MSWDTVVLTWCRHTLVVEHEQAIQYGAISDGRFDRVTCHAPTPSASGEGYPIRNFGALETRNPLGLAEKTPRLVSQSPPKPAQ